MSTVGIVGLIFGIIIARNCLEISKLRERIRGTDKTVNEIYADIDRLRRRVIELIIKQGIAQ